VVHDVVILARMARMNETDNCDYDVTLQPSLDKGWLVIKPPKTHKGEYGPFKVEIKDIEAAIEAIAKTNFGR